MKHPATLAARVSLLLIPAALLFSFPALSRHKVLYEKFTNTGCNPCARFAPHSDSLVNMRLGDVVAITYHGNYPDPNDPFFTSTSDKGVSDLVSLYNLTGYPSVLLDGTECAANVDMMSEEIDRLLATPQYLKIGMAASTDDDGFIDASVDITTLIPLTMHDPRLFVAVMEEETVSPLPTSSGQKEFINEFRSFLHDKEGISLTGLDTEGSHISIPLRWKIEGIKDMAQMAFVAWVQDRASMKVIEAEYLPRPAARPLDAAVLTHSDYPQGICSPEYYSSGLFRNTGSETITSCEIAVEINGYTQKTLWTGELAYLETAAYSTPPFADFLLSEGSNAANSVKVYISGINGTDAEGAPLLSSFSSATEASGCVQLTLFTDNAPEEISWTLSNSSGVILDRSEPYTEKRHIYRHTFPLVADDCYTISFSDSGENGISGANGYGYVKLTQITSDGKQKVILQEEYDTASHTVNFRLSDADATAGLHPTAENTSHKITSDGITPASNTHVTLTDTRGINILSCDAAAGRYLSWPALQSGVYIVTLSSEDYSERYIFRK